MRNCYLSLKERYQSIKEYFQDFWAYVNEDSISYTKAQRRRLEDLVEKARDKALVESTLKSLEK